MIQEAAGRRNHHIRAAVDLAVLILEGNPADEQGRTAAAPDPAHVRTKRLGAGGSAHGCPSRQQDLLGRCSHRPGSFQLGPQVELFSPTLHDVASPLSPAY